MSWRKKATIVTGKTEYFRHLLRMGGPFLSFPHKALAKEKLFALRCKGIRLFLPLNSTRVFVVIFIVWCLSQHVADVSISHTEHRRLPRGNGKWLNVFSQRQKADADGFSAQSIKSLCLYKIRITLSMERETSTSHMSRSQEKPRRSGISSVNVQKVLLGGNLRTQETNLRTPSIFH